MRHLKSVFLLLLIIIPFDICNALGLKLEQEFVGDNVVSVLVKYTKDQSDADLKFVDFGFVVKYSKAKLNLKEYEVLLKGDWKSTRTNDFIKNYTLQSANGFKKNDESLMRLTFEYDKEKGNVYGSEISLESVMLEDSSNEKYTLDKSYLKIAEVETSTIDKKMLLKCAVGIIVVLLGIKLILKKMFGNSITSTELQKMDEKYKQKMYNDVPKDINRNIRQ